MLRVESKLMDTQELFLNKNLEDAKITRGKIEFKHVSFHMMVKPSLKILVLCLENQTVALW